MMATLGEVRQQRGKAYICGLHDKAALQLVCILARDDTTDCGRDQHIAQQGQQILLGDCGACGIPCSYFADLQSSHHALVISSEHLESSTRVHPVISYGMGAGW